MAIKTLTDIQTQLSTGGSSGRIVEQDLIKDIVDSFVHEDTLTTELAAELEDYQLAAGPFVLPTYTVAGIPATGTEGEIVYVTDGLLPIAIWDGVEWLYADGTSVVV